MQMLFFNREEMSKDWEEHIGKLIEKGVLIVTIEAERSKETDKRPNKKK
jgi:hypothetical protein